VDTQSKPAELQDAFQVREAHLDLLALASRLLKLFGAGERSDNVAGGFVNMRRGSEALFSWLSPADKRKS
jgi:hypothetical protein